MDLNNRRIKILTSLLNAETGASLTDLAKQFGVTKRMLSYDIEEINAWLKIEKMGVIKVNKGVAHLQSRQREELRWKGKAHQEYRFSVEERQRTEYLHITLSAERTTSQDFCLFFDVSANTVFTDIKALKAMLKGKGLALHSTNKEGYLIQGPEEGIRRLIGEAYNVLTVEYPRKMLHLLVQESLETLMGEDLDFFALVFAAIRDFERRMNTKLLTVDIDYLITMLLVVHIRNLKGFRLIMPSQEREALRKTREYQAVKAVMDKLEKDGIALAESEAFYITSLFLCAKNFDSTTPEVEDAYIRDFTQKLIGQYERITCTQFSEEEYLKNRLYLHIRSMYYRLKYNVPVENKLLPQIREMYAEDYRYTQRALQNIGGKIARSITEEETAFLCTYMISSFNIPDAPQRPPRNRVLIICDAGVASAVLLHEQLIRLIGNVYSYDIVPAFVVTQKSLNEYDLIISTVQMETKNDSTIITGPTLSQQDQKRILMIMGEKETAGTTQPRIADILAVVRKHATIQDEDELYMDLVRMRLNGHAAVPPLSDTELPALLNEADTVQFILQPATVEQALWQAARPLLHREDDCAQAVRQMWEHIQTDGSFYEMAPQVGLEFFRSSENRMGISFLVSPQEPLRFGRQEIRVLIVLSCVGNSLHHRLLGYLYKFFGRKTNVKKLLHAQEADHARRLLVDQYLNGAIRRANSAEKDGATS